MNVVVLSETASVSGGKAKIAFDGARAVSALGHAVHLVCGNGPVSDELTLQPNLTIHALGQNDIASDGNRVRAMVHGWWNPSARRYVGALLDSLNPDDTVVHVHSWTRALSASAIRAVIDRRFAIVLTTHDFLIACPTGTFFLQHRRCICRHKAMSLSCICSPCDSRSYRHKLWRVGRLAVQRHFGGIPLSIQHFIVPSYSAADILRPYFPQDAIVHCIPNTIDIDQQPPVDVGSHKEFVFVGRLTAEKGAELFAQAAALEVVPCRFVGDGSARAAIARVNPRAHITGWMAHRDGLQALRSARALVFPSRWHEVQPLVVLEAAGNGVPSIVSDTCAARELVVDGVTGLHFRTGDVSDLRDKIRMLKDPEIATRLGKGAYDAFWVSHKGWRLPLHGRQLEATYKSVIATRRS